MKRNSKDIHSIVKEEYKQFLKQLQKAGMEEFKQKHMAEIVDAANQYEA